MRAFVIEQPLPAEALLVETDGFQQEATGGLIERETAPTPLEGMGGEIIVQLGGAQATKNIGNLIANERIQVLIFHGLKGGAAEILVAANGSTHVGNDGFDLCVTDRNRFAHRTASRADALGVKPASSAC